MSDPQRPYGLQPTRLLHPWYFLGKSTGVGCHRLLHQGKLEVVKKEMARVNVDILGISELKWTGMGELTQMTIISTTVDRNPSEEME